MKRYLLIILQTLCVGVCIPLRAQSTTYYCNNKYCIELPNKLELQSSELNSIRNVNTDSNKPRINISTLSRNIIFQQKGLNADIESAYKKYCRVIIQYFKQNRNAPVFGVGDKIVIDKDILYDIYEAANENCLSTGTPLLKLMSKEAISINGFPVIYYSYKRKGVLKENGKRCPPVIVNVYTIYNKYEYVILTFSYREAERENWKGIYKNIIKTFSFTRKY